MCGRFTLTSPTDELAGYFNVLVKTQLAPRYNIAPTQPVVCIRPEHELAEMRWGLIPYWAKDAAIGNRMINARAESVAEKPAYKQAFRRRRCLVLADGFYEWKKLGGAKQPYFIRLRDSRPFAFGGLFEHWKPGPGQLEKITGPSRPAVPLTGDGRVASCAFLTTAPNDLMETIHDRMPLILSPSDWDRWLDPEIDDPTLLADLLRPYPAEEMQAHPVSTRVNKPEHDDPGCIEPLATLRITRPPRPDATRPEASAQRLLFGEE